ncbi:hypothetical protein SAY87_015932 [Trapa incisa]|uniref:Pectinesterase n=1 Tax=Trapa incisa TaxID=236973 RepID=A0AAN7LFU3_9MYRT|nr:hypothetical protein SAY87_015932 [Trapa incisa]
MDTTTRRRSLLCFSALLLFSSLGHAALDSSNMAIGGVAATHRRNLHEEIARSHCEGTLYPELCVSTVASFPSLASQSLPQVIAATINLTAGEVHAADDNCSRLEHNWLKRLAPLDQRALDDCRELFGETVDEFNGALSDLSGTSSASKHIHDLQTLLSGNIYGYFRLKIITRSVGCRLATVIYLFAKILSALGGSCLNDVNGHSSECIFISDVTSLINVGAMTNQYTCLDGLAYSNTNVSLRDRIEKRLVQISRHISNSLAMLKKIPGANDTQSTASGMLPDYGSLREGFPSWVSRRDRRLLQTSTGSIKYNLVVAKDGTGNFTSIADAVAAAPNSSTTRFVIYIKTGTYLENVEVASKKTNLMLVGDGIGKTLVKGNRNVVDGWTTFRSATVAVVGTGFIAKGITFENYAGPDKHQAVALRSGSDLSVFYQCSFVAYQDTLYVHSLRQFYRDCDVYGTVDFIFGNAAVVFQNCNLYARKPSSNQKNIFTAQGREDPNQNTGISVLNCKVTAAADLIPVKSSFKTYLGRPWKEYSRTVFMKSNIEDVVDPAGWLEWNGSFALSTLYYGEYMNRGNGSSTSKRVTWPGYRVINSSTEASQFTVGQFIQGTQWLNDTGVPYYAGLS